MTDPRRVLRRYFEQQAEAGETRLVLPRDGVATLTAVGGPSIVVDEAGEPDESSAAGASPPTPAQPQIDPDPAEDAEPKWLRGAPSIPGPGLEIVPPDTNLFVSDPLAEASLEQLADMVRSCTRCQLCRTRTNGVPGEGAPNAQLMVVGEGPGAKEDETGRPFVGAAGQLLNEILNAIGCPRETVFIANIVKCRPPSNRAPERDEVGACIPYLYRQIDLIRPSVILAMGGTAATALLDSRGSLGSLRNKVHRFRGIPLIVTYHPAALLRNPQWKKPTWDDVRIARRLFADRH